MVKLRRLIKGNNGQGLVEMAFILPILILLLFGMVEFGRVFNAFLVTKEASREGARLAIVGNNRTVVEAAARGVGGLWDPISAVITYKLNGTTINGNDLDDAEKGDAVTVTVTYDVDLIAPVISGILPDPFTVTGSTVMRVE